MGGRNETGEPRRGTLPIVLALFSLVFSALLFMTGTVPALRESEELRETQQRRREQLNELLLRSQDLRQRQQALEWDPQTVLVEIDRLGRMPDDLLEDFPQQDEEAGDPSALRKEEVSPR